MDHKRSNHAIIAGVGRRQDFYPGARTDDLRAGVTERWRGIGCDCHIQPCRSWRAAAVGHAQGEMRCRGVAINSDGRGDNACTANTEVTDRHAVERGAGGVIDRHWQRVFSIFGVADDSDDSGRVGAARRAAQRW